MRDFFFILPSLIANKEKDWTHWKEFQNFLGLMTPLKNHRAPCKKIRSNSLSYVALGDRNPPSSTNKSLKFYSFQTCFLRYYQIDHEHSRYKLYRQMVRLHLLIQFLLTLPDVFVRHTNVVGEYPIGNRCNHLVAHLDQPQQIVPEYEIDLRAVQSSIWEEQTIALALLGIRNTVTARKKSLLDEDLFGIKVRTIFV